MFSPRISVDMRVNSAASGRDVRDLSAVHDTAGDGDGDNTSQANSVKISRRETREMCRTKYKYTWRNLK